MGAPGPATASSSKSRRRAKSGCASSARSRSRNPPSSPPSRWATAEGARGQGCGLPKTARIEEHRTICPANAEHYGILAIIGSLRTEGGSAIARQLSPEQPNGRFGVDENQVRHTFRYTDQLGLDRDAVSNAIRADLARQGPASPGANITGNISVSGVTIEYRAFGLADGTINVGRITGP